MTISSQSSSRRQGNDPLEDFLLATCDSPSPISGTVSPATTGKSSPYALSLDGKTSGASTNQAVDACKGSSIWKDKSLTFLALNMFISTAETQKLQQKDCKVISTKTGKGTISSRFWQSLACSSPCIDDRSTNLSQQKTQKHGNASEEWERDHAWSFPGADVGKNSKKMKNRKQKKDNLERTGKWATIKAFFTRKKKSGDHTHSSGNCSQLESMNPTETDEEGDCASITSELSSVYVNADGFSPNIEQHERSPRTKSVSGNVGKVKVTDILKNPSGKERIVTRSLSKLPCRQADIDVNPYEKFPLLDLQVHATPVSAVSSPVSSNTAPAKTFQQRREGRPQSVSRKYNVESMARTRKSLARHKESLSSSSPARSKRVSPHRDIRKRTPAVETDTRQLKVSGSLGNMTNSVAIAKQSNDPYQDFKESMLDMIRLKNLKDDQELEDLLKCYLSLNGPQFHSLIIKVFAEVCPPY